MRERRFLIECICTVSFLILSIWYLGILLRPTDADPCFDAIKSFHNAPENTFDVICYGSSHGWHGFSTPKLNEDLGIHSYNYGCNWQQLNTEKLFLEDSLRTQHPRVVLIETYRVGNIIENQPIDGEVYYSRAISNFPGKREYLRQCLGTDPMINLSYYVPFVAFHENWMNINSESFWQYDNSEPYDYKWGFSTGSPGGAIHIPENACSVQKPLPAKSIECLDDIIRICNKNNIKIIFYTTPYADVYEYGDAMTEYARKNNCIYVNFFDKMDEAGIDEETDFADWGHLDTAGAEKVTVYLEGFILEQLHKNN